MISKADLLCMAILLATLLAACSPLVESVATATMAPNTPVPASTFTPTQILLPSPTATQPQTPTATEPQTPTATAIPPTTPAKCGSGWTRLTEGGYAMVLPGLPNRVRSRPSTVGDILSPLNPGTVFQLLEGPVCADGLVFWRMEHASIPGGSGWTAEGDLAEYYLEPVERVDCSGYGVSFLLPASWDC